MDRDELRTALPQSEAFFAMQAYEKKDCVLDYVESILDAIEADGREADEWESFNLSAAVGMCMARWYHAALFVADRGLVPPQQRAPMLLKSGDPLPSLGQLRDLLTYARAVHA